MVETLLLLPELQPCRHPVVFVPMAAVVQPEDEEVQFVTKLTPESEEVTEVLALPPSTPALSTVFTAVEVTVAIRVEVMRGEAVGKSEFEIKDVVAAKVPLMVVDAYGPFEVVTELPEQLLVGAFATGSLPEEDVDDAPQSTTMSTETDPEEGRLNGLSFLLACSLVVRSSRAHRSERAVQRLKNPRRNERAL